jgi:hypothetical protein
MVREGPAEKLPEEYPAEKARGSEIILRKRWQRYVFMAGLAGAVLLPLLFLFFAGS